jgi:hypothetical protein
MVSCWTTWIIEVNLWMCYVIRVCKTQMEFRTRRISASSYFFPFKLLIATKLLCDVLLPIDKDRVTRSFAFPLFEKSEPAGGQALTSLIRSTIFMVLSHNFPFLFPKYPEINHEKLGVLTWCKGFGPRRNGYILLF